MKLKIGMVLLAALVVEALNFAFLAPPLDVGYEPGTPWYIEWIGMQWILLHYAGLRSSDWFDRVSGCRARNVPGGCGQVDTVVFFVSGYLSTALLLLAITFGFPRLLRLLRRYSAKRA